MTNPYTAPIPPIPPAPSRPPNFRPLHKRVLVWIGGSALFAVGALIGAVGNDQQPAATTKAKPTTVVTETATATPEPGPTVTETVKAKAKPAPTVTVTKTATAKAAGSSGGSSTGGSGGSTGGQNDTGTCSIRSNSGNCYSAGQFCRNTDHGSVTTNAGGTKIKCAYSSNSWRWTYV